MKPQRKYCVWLSSQTQTLIECHEFETQEQAQNFINGILESKEHIRGEYSIWTVVKGDNADDE